ncbi:MAG: hypothetical protein ABWY36_07175 [Leifsonia sp.]
MRRSRVPVLAALCGAVAAPLLLTAIAVGPAMADPDTPAVFATDAPAAATETPPIPDDYVPGDPVLFVAPAAAPPVAPPPTPTPAPFDEIEIVPQPAPLLAPAPVTPAPPRAAAPRIAAAPPAEEAAPAVAVDDSNALTNMLPTFADFVEHPELVAAGVATAVGLMALVILPAELLNATLSARYVSLFAWAAALAPARLRRANARVSATVASRPIIGGVGITAAAAFIFCFVDPTFGFTLPSLRLFLALLLGLFVIGYLASALTALVLRERWHMSSALQLRPLALLLTIVGVAASRLLDFSPGILVGLVFGLTVAGLPEGSRAAVRPVLVRAGIILVLGIGAWVAYNMIFAGAHHPPEASATTSNSSVQAAATEDGHGEEETTHEEPAPAEESTHDEDGTTHDEEGGSHGEATTHAAEEPFFTALAGESLHAITAEGLTALVIGLLPFRFLEGKEVWGVSRRLWTGVYLLVLASWCVLVLSSQHNWEVLGDSPWGWLGFIVAWAVAAIALYTYHSRRAAREEALEHDPEHESSEGKVGG